MPFVTSTILACVVRNSLGVNSYICVVVFSLFLFNTPLFFLLTSVSCLSISLSLSCVHALSFHLSDIEYPYHIQTDSSPLPIFTMVHIS